MVYFVCSGCNDSLKKPKVAKHLSFCRCCYILTCLDCQKEFTPESYVAHTQCVSELEKYSGRNYVEPANANKGQKKQLSWMDSVKAAAANYSKQVPLNSREERQINSLLSSLLRFDNIPRKKAKFENFVKSALGQFRRDQAAIDGAWSVISTPAPEDSAKTQEHHSNGTVNANEKIIKEEVEGEENEINAEPTEKKKKKRTMEEEEVEKEDENETIKPKKKKKRKIEEEEVEKEDESETIKPKKKKKRKIEEEVEEEVKEEEKEEDEEENQREPMRKKKKKKEKTEKEEEPAAAEEEEEAPLEPKKKRKESEDDAEEKENEDDSKQDEGESEKFVLAPFVTNLLQSRGSSGISLAKLEKRAVRQYMRQFARPNKEPRPERVKRKLKLVIAKHFREIDGRVFEREAY